jgi:PIN domain nuclease of toxin-antitoxin system
MPVTFLLDTHLLIWAVREPEQLSAEALNLIDDNDNELVFSVISIWETAIKSAFRKPNFRTDARLLRRRLLDNGYVELPLLGTHSVAIDMLPQIHKDPFDRILVAQAMVEGITLLTVDPLVAEYPGPVRRV